MTNDVAPLPCPFCGSNVVQLVTGSTFRWRALACAECGAQCGEIRAQDDETQTVAAAIAAWNTRAELAPGGSQTQPNIAAAESGTGAASNELEKLRGVLDWVQQYLPAHGRESLQRVLEANEIEGTRYPAHDMAKALREIGAMIPSAAGGTFENDPPGAIVSALKRAASLEPGAPRCPRCNGPEGWHSMTCGRRLSIVAAEIRNDASAAILQNYAVPAQASEDWRLVHDWGPDCEYRWIRTCKCSRCAQNRRGDSNG